MVGVERVALPGGEHPARRDESCQLIDVPVRVVAREFASRPEHALHAEHLGQHPLEGRPIEAGIAPRIDDAPLVDEERAVAVRLDRAPLEHDAPVEHGQAEPPGERARHAGVVVPRRILSTPRIPPERHGGRRQSGAGWWQEKDRSGVAQPRVVRRDLLELDAADVGEITPRRGQRLSRGEDPHRLVRRDCPGDRREDRRHLGEVAEPRRAAMRPREEGREVRLPFGREPIAEVGRCGGQGGHGGRRAGCGALTNSSA